MKIQIYHVREMFKIFFFLSSSTTPLLRNKRFLFYDFWDDGFTSLSEIINTFTKVLSPRFKEAFHSPNNYSPAFILNRLLKFITNDSINF